MTKITARQQQVLDYMRAFHAENDQLPPMWSVCEHFGWTAMNSAQGHARILEEKGYLERNAIGNLRFAREKAVQG